MPKFKVEVSKDQKKYNIVIAASNAKEAKEKVHKEGYSILNIESFDEQTLSGEKFYFEIEKNGDNKSGIIYGDEIFKVFLKLKKDLGYKVIFLYKDLDETQEKKEDLIKNLNDAYLIYEKNQDKSKNEKKVKEKKVESKKEDSIDGFYMKKELEATYKLIDHVIEKIDTVLESKNLGVIEDKKRQKLEEVYNNIIKIKSSTNLSKLKEVGELALLKIGQLELEIVEKEKNIYAKQFLKETNKLLKQIGSDKHFIEKDKDIKFIINSNLEKFNKFFREIKRERKLAKGKQLDKTSYDYLKTVALLNRYKQRLREVDIEILKKILYFIIPSKKEEISKILLTRSVLRQNIIIMRAKKSGKIYSYTKVIKGKEKIFNWIIKQIKAFNEYIFYVIVIFSIIFVLFVLNNHLFSENSGNFNYDGLYYVILLMIFSFLLKFIRGFISLSIVIIGYLGIMTFAQINF